MTDWRRKQQFWELFFNVFNHAKFDSAWKIFRENIRKIDFTEFLWNNWLEQIMKEKRNSWIFRQIIFCFCFRNVSISRIFDYMRCFTTQHNPDSLLQDMKWRKNWFLFDLHWKSNSSNDFTNFSNETFEQIFNVWILNDWALIFFFDLLIEFVDSFPIYWLHWFDAFVWYELPNWQKSNWSISGIRWLQRRGRCGVRSQWQGLAWFKVCFN